MYVWFIRNKTSRKTTTINVAQKKLNDSEVNALVCSCLASFKIMFAERLRNCQTLFFFTSGKLKVLLKTQPFHKNYLLFE